MRHITILSFHCHFFRARYDLHVTVHSSDPPSSSRNVPSRPLGPCRLCARRLGPARLSGHRKIPCDAGIGWETTADDWLTHSIAELVARGLEACGGASARRVRGERLAGCGVTVRHGPSRRVAALVPRYCPRLRLLMTMITPSLSNVRPYHALSA